MKFSGFEIQYSDKPVTPFGGLVLMKELVERTGILSQMQQSDIPQNTSPNGYDPMVVIQSFWVSVWCGACKFLQIEHIRFDETLKEIFGWAKIPSHVTFGRFFKKFSWKRNNAVFPGIMEWFLAQMQLKSITLDFDSTVMTRYGEQEGSLKGYNPNKRGRASHHPIIAFIAELRMVANAWLRSGNTASASSFREFLEETLRILKDKTIGLLRADSGFYSETVFSLLEGKNILYVIAAKMQAPLKMEITQLKKWTALDAGVWISELYYQCSKWTTPRRIIVIRQDVRMRPQATGKKLFDDAAYYQHYRYHALVTNQTLPAQQIWEQYKQRADAENRIKELKYEFAIEGFNAKEFFATEAAFRMVMIAYNLMSLFRQCILQSPVQQRLSTIRFNCFTVGSWMVKQGNSRVLKMSLKMKRREWMDGLFRKTSEFSMPRSF